MATVDEELARVRRLAVARSNYDADWRKAVIKACDTHSMRAVAEAAGITPGRVHQIVKAAREG